MGRSERDERNQLLFAGNVVRGKWRTEGWPDVMAPSTQPRLLLSGIRSVSIVPFHPAPRPLSRPPSSFYLSIREVSACLCPSIYWRVFARYRIGDVSAARLSPGTKRRRILRDKIAESKCFLKFRVSCEVNS